MNKQLLYRGSSIDLVQVVSGIQSFIEAYIGSLISGITTGRGIIYAASVYDTGFSPTSGAELVTNGKFQSSLTGTWTVSDPTYVQIYAGSGGGFDDSVSLAFTGTGTTAYQEIGSPNIANDATYTLTFEVIGGLTYFSGSGQNGTVSIFQSYDGTNYNALPDKVLSLNITGAWQKQTITFTSTSTNKVKILFSAYANSGAAAIKIDNVSFKTFSPPLPAPAYLYFNGNDLYLAGNNARFIFGDTAPYTVYPVPTSTLVQAGLVTTGVLNTPYYVYATLTTGYTGTLMRIAEGLVLNSTSTTGYSQSYDNVTYSITTSPITSSANPVILLGIITKTNGSDTLYDNMYRQNSFTFDLRPNISRDIVTQGVLPKFEDRYIELNSLMKDLVSLGQTAGLKVNLNPSFMAEFLLTYDTMSEWTSNIPVAGPDPTNNNQYTTKQWVINYITQLLEVTEVPINVRLDSISGYLESMPVDSSMLSKLSNSFNSTTGWSGHSSGSNTALVNFKWGYDSILGTSTSTSNTFQITSGATSFANEALVGYYLYIPSLSLNLKIVDNVNLLLTLEQTDGSTWSSSGFTVTSGQEVTIYSNASSYVVQAIPIISGVQQKTNIVSTEVSFIPSTSTIVLQQAQLPLQVGVNYVLTAKAKLNTFISNSTVLSSFLVQIPNIDSTGASVSAVSTFNGFQVSIAGWNEAQSFEIVYTTASGGASFTDQTQQHVFSTSKTYDVVTSSLLTYYVKVRPLICGQQVASDAEIQAACGGGSSGIASFSLNAGGSNYRIGDVLSVAGGTGATVTVTAVAPGASGAVTNLSLTNKGYNYSTGTAIATTGGSGSGCTVNILTVYTASGSFYGIQVMSGSGGYLPTDNAVINYHVFQPTYAGTLGGSTAIGSAGWALYNITAVTTPATSGSGETVYSLPTSLVGEIYTDSIGNDFVISTVSTSSGSLSMSVKNIIGTSGAPASSGSFTIGTSKYARNMTSPSVPTTILLTKIAGECDLIQGGPVTIRVYQPGNEAGAGYVVVTKEGSINQLIAVRIASMYGPLNVTLDLWDPAGVPVNTGTFVGNIIVYGRATT